MLLNSTVWNIWHPGRYLPPRHNVYLSSEGVEVAVEEGLDDRPLLVRAGSMLTFGFLFRQKKRVRQQSFALENSNSHHTRQ